MIPERLAVFHKELRGVGGAELLAASHVAFLRERGIDVSVVTFAYDEGTWASRLGGAPVRRVERKVWSDALGLSAAGKLARRGRRAVRVLSEWDVVVAHNAPCSAMLGMAGAVIPRKVWYCHEPHRALHREEANPRLAALAAAPGSDDEPDALRAFRRTLQRAARGGSAGRAARRAYDLRGARGLDEVWANSAFTGENVRRVYGGSVPVHVIPPMVRFREGAGRARRGIDRSALRLLTLSRLEEYKNVDTVIRAVARLVSTGRAVELHVVGEGPARAGLEALAHERGAERAVTFHGFLPDADLDRVAEACDAFVLLPFDEPFGMVFAEAADRGLLVIGPDHGGPLEILDGGRLGWTVDVTSPEALAAALEEVHGLDDAEAERRREAARDACRSRYDRETIGRLLLERLDAG